MLRLLTRCYLEIPPQMQTQIEALSVEQLETLGEALLDFSRLEEVEQWLQNLT
ncbi:DUF4351 domain-containing protein [Spirulina subsalsa FACHB-351]|uniref:DUF4351 domain-containing protein n=1 Tax=Spirulina subsalsa FACHB-351 TaxID=234711 RepID=A0ABT3L1P6_9CYAN|nr:DUF4351 domain-containing protein [Spirulina subsalsa FACHB-351]